MRGVLCESAAMPFADDVRKGLLASPKTLPSKYFYDQLGSALFEAICLLPEYYLTRAESEILSTRATDIIAVVQPARLIELGSGSAVKTRYLIEAALRRRNGLEYSAIDISQTSLEATAKALRIEYPVLAVHTYQAEYFDGLRKLARDAQGPALMLFLGSNIGNFEPPEAQRFMRAIRDVLAPGDALLLGTDLKKDKAKLEAAYDDALGVTAAFNLNLLARINRELEGSFDLGSFRHLALYNEAAGRVEMHLVSSRDQICRIGALDLDVSFKADETIHTESSYKFSVDDVNLLARASEFVREGVWTDAKGWFACNLLRVAS